MYSQWSLTITIFCVNIYIHIPQKLKFNISKSTILSLIYELSWWYVIWRNTPLAVSLIASIKSYMSLYISLLQRVRENICSSSAGCQPLWYTFTLIVISLLVVFVVIPKLICYRSANNFPSYSSNIGSPDINNFNIYVDGVTNTSFGTNSYEVLWILLWPFTYVCSL